MTTLTPLKPADVARRLETQSAVLIDIREPDEFAREHVAGAIHAPLSSFDQVPLKLPDGRDVIYTCRTGTRTGLNCARLASRVPGEAFVLAGGLDGWKAQGLATERADPGRSN